MAFNTHDFRSRLVGDGARPNLFNVSLTIPGTIAAGGAAASAMATFMIKSAQLPGSTIGTVPQYYFGREMKFAGNRTFPDWTVTIVNDENFLIRNSLESWMNSIGSHVGNVRSIAAIAPRQYTSDSLVTQYNKDGSVSKQYNFVGLFPVDVSTIDLDWGSNDSIEEYSVTFAYQYWTSAPFTDNDTTATIIV